MKMILKTYGLVWFDLFWFGFISYGIRLLSRCTAFTYEIDLVMTIFMIFVVVCFGFV